MIGIRCKRCDRHARLSVTRILALPGGAEVGQTGYPDGGTYRDGALAAEHHLIHRAPGKASLRKKGMAAGWDDDFLAGLICKQPRPPDCPAGRSRSSQFQRLDFTLGR